MIPCISIGCVNGPMRHGRMESCRVGDDLAIVLGYLGQSYVPYEVGLAMRRLQAARRFNAGETGLGPGMIPSPTGRYLDLVGSKPTGHIAEPFDQETR